MAPAGDFYKLLTGCSLFLFFALSCGDAPADAPDLAVDMGTPAIVERLHLESVTKLDPSGTGSADCPPMTRVIGGGCQCETTSQYLHQAAPDVVANSYRCACYDGAVVKHGVTAIAVCLTSP